MLVSSYLYLNLQQNPRKSHILSFSVSGNVCVSLFRNMILILLNSKNDTVSYINVCSVGAESYILNFSYERLRKGLITYSRCIKSDLKLRCWCLDIKNFVTDTLLLLPNSILISMPEFVHTSQCLSFTDNDIDLMLWGDGSVAAVLFWKYM